MRAILSLLGLLVSLGVHAAPLYESDFASRPDGPADLPDWSLSGGDFHLRDGWLCVASDRDNPVAVLPVKQDGDVTFRARVRGAIHCHWTALLARRVYRLEVNNQFVHVALLRKVGNEWRQVASAPGYRRYAASAEQFELRLVVHGDRVMGFVDTRKVVEYRDPDPVPVDGEYALLGGWGTRVAWRDISVSDEPDEREWPRERLPEARGAELVEVTQVRGLSDEQPPVNVYTDGQTGGVRIAVRSRLPKPGALRLRFRLLDVHQRLRAQQVQRVALQPGEERQLTAAFRAPARGCFKVSLDAARDGEPWGWVEDLGSFVVVASELETRPRDADSLFGSHMDGIHLQWHLRIGRKLGVQWARCHDMMQWTWWDRVQPDSRDQWRWYDEAQRTVDELGFRTSGEFLWVPGWAQRPGAPADPRTYPPADLRDFARYVYETVLHYKGSIHHWEVWNEPHFSGFFSGTPEQYADLLRVAYREAKRADPACTVIGGGGVNLLAMDWIRQMLQAAGGQNMDAFSIHYLDPSTAAAGLRELRAMLSAVGFRGPIWNTEECVESSSFLDQCRRDYAEPEAPYHFRNACYELVRVYMENLAGGVQRVFYYDLADPWRMKTFAKPRVFEPTRLTGSLWDEGSMLKPVAAAHAALALAIDGMVFRRRMRQGAREGFVFAAPDGRRAAAVIYATYPTFSQRKRLTLALPPGKRPERLQVMDFMGNVTPVGAEAGSLQLTLSREPVYLLYRGDSAERLLVRIVQQAG